MPPQDNPNRPRPKKPPAKAPLAYIGPEPQAKHGNTQKRLREQIDAETQTYLKREGERSQRNQRLRTAPAPQAKPPQPFVPSPPDDEGRFVKPWQGARPPTEAETSQWSDRVFSNPKAMERITQAKGILDIARQSQMPEIDLAELVELETGLNAQDGTMAIDAANAIIEKFKNSPLAMLRVIN
jgi:hypothetical protein